LQAIGQVTRRQPDIERIVALEGADTHRCIIHHAGSGRMQLATAIGPMVDAVLMAAQTRFGYQYRLQGACITVIGGERFSVIAGADDGSVLQRPGLMGREWAASIRHRRRRQQTDGENKTQILQHNTAFNLVQNSDRNLNPNALNPGIEAQLT